MRATHRQGRLPTFTADEFQRLVGTWSSTALNGRLLVDGPEGIPTSVKALESIPFVTARVLHSGDIDGEVEILSSVLFVDWMRSLSLDPEPLEPLLARLSPARLSQLVETAARTGATLWSSTERRWRTATDISLVYVERHTPGLRIAVMRTNASPGFVTHVERRTRATAG